jgi:hypothetical protein
MNTKISVGVLSSALFFTTALFADDFHNIQAHGVADFRYFYIDSVDVFGTGKTINSSQRETLWQIGYRVFF